MDVSTAEAHEVFGPLPPDWRIGRIEEIANVGSGGTPSRKNPAYWGGTIPWVTTAQIEFGTITDASEYITDAGLRGSAARMLAPGALLLALYGQGKTRGKVAKLGIAAATNQACASIVPSGQVDGDYLFHFLASRYQALRSASNAGSQENLSGRIVKETLVALPPKAEQVAIASALSDVDALLTKLDHLIAKKRDLKQAAMQQLLAGRTRLPGLASEWARRPLGSVLAICHGKSQRDVESPDGPYPILATGGQIGAASAWLYDKPSVLIGRKGTIDRPQYMEVPFWTVDTLFYSVMKGANCAKFFYYRFCLIDWAKYNEASGVPSLNARTIEAIEVDCPEPAEQVEIARVLSDMDAELAALEARRDKTRQLKQGMMQALLTGRIRLA